MPTAPPDWTELDATVRKLDRRSLAGVVGRAAERVVPRAANAEAAFGPEAVEWLNALDAAARVVAAVAAGVEVSAFTLGIAADLARAVPAARVNVSRKTGVGSVAAVEELEHVCAAVGFAADAVRATTEERAVRAAMQCVSNADAAWGQVGKLAAFDAKMFAGGAKVADLGDLWPAGDPEWFLAGRATLAAARGRLPRLLEVR